MSRERAGQGLSRYLWNQIITFANGKNIYTVMPHEAAVNFLRRYHFHVSVAGDIMHGPIKLKPTSLAPNRKTVVKDYVEERDRDGLIAYDHAVLGFGRGYYLGLALAEPELTVKIAFNANGQISGYVGVQNDQRRCPVLRWFLADDTSTAEDLLRDVVETCEAVRQKGVLGAFYVFSPITQAILNEVDRSHLESWVLIYNRREPFSRCEKIVSLTYV